MKKLLLMGALALCTLFANAQDYQGVWFVGGQLGFNHTKTGDAKTNTYTILPTIGTFISPDVAVGASLGYSGSKAGEVKDNDIIFAPLVRKYWALGNSGFNFFGQASLPINFGNTKRPFSTEGAEGLIKTNNFGVHVELAPGFDYIINGKWSFETSINLLSVGYTQKKIKGSDTKTTGFGLNANPNTKFADLRIGFKFLF